MATVYVGRAAGAGGFSRIVAIKRARPELAANSGSAAMFLDEARMASCIRHPNVGSILDVVEANGELFLVMEYVHGEPLSKLVKVERTAGAVDMPLGVVSRIMADALEGLEAAHKAVGPRGAQLGLVHRDVSPSNMLVGADGITRLIDFGVAKAAGRLHTTCNGDVRGKLGYLAPEQILGKPVTRRTDVWAASVVLWELLTRRRLFFGAPDADLLQRILFEDVRPPSAHAAFPPGLDEIVSRGLRHDPERRFSSAREMANALSACVPPCSPGVAADWIGRLAGDELRSRMDALVAFERTPRPVAGRASSPVVARPRSRARMAAAATALLTLSAAAVFVARRPSQTGPVLEEPRAAPLGEAAIVHIASEPPESASPARDQPVAPAPARPTRARAELSPRRPEALPDCHVPYVVDGVGTRVYKRECL
jgi:serine/threonine-protein kinase